MGALAVAVLLIAYLVSQSLAQSDGSRRATHSQSYRDAYGELGMDAAAFEREVRTQGLEPSEALSVSLVVCRETGDCPAGVSQREAREFICRRTGDC